MHFSFCKTMKSSLTKYQPVCKLVFTSSPIFWGPRLGNPTKPWDSYGYDTITSWAEFWLHNLAEQQRGGLVRISNPFGKSTLNLWIHSCGTQSRAEQAVGDLCAQESWPQLSWDSASFTYKVGEGGKVVSPDTPSSGLLQFGDRQGTGMGNFPERTCASHSPANLCVCR